MNKTFEQHRLKFQARQPMGIGKTKQVNPDTFFFPINSLIHYQSSTLQEMGMMGNNTLLHNWSASDDIFLSHVLEGYGDEGKPKERNISNSFVTNFFKYNTRFARVRNLERTVSKPRNLIVLDYSLLPHKLHYMQSMSQFYYEFINIATAYESNLKLYGELRENFIPIYVPEVIPDRSRFTKADEEAPGTDELKIFNSSELFWLRELWLLCSGKGMFSRIGELTHVNILLIDHGTITSVNLGLFKELADNETKAQKTLLELFDSIVSNRSPIETEELVELTEESPAEKSGEEKVTSSSVVSPRLKEKVEELTKSGTLTHKEAERFVKLAAKTRDLPSPMGEGTIGELIETTPEETIIEPSVRNTGNSHIVKESMRRSRTTNMTKDYVKKSLEKDIARNLVSLESMGIVVKSIERKEVLDAINDNYEYRISFLMANGKQGTRTLRIPHVNENGMFKANGVENIMTTQKIDAPIRKTGPSTASLTSYAGKIFINRSDKSVNDRGAWLVKKLIKFGLDTDDTRVTKVRLGTNEVPLKTKLPRDYVATMGKVSAFLSNGITFNFEYKDIDSNFGDLVKVAQKNDLLICGTKGTTVIAMGLDNVLYSILDGKVEALGFLNEVIGGNWGKEPIDMHVVGIFGKTIPLGLLLGRHTGLDTVLKRTGIRYRKSPSNVRMAAEKDEFVIKFKDVNLFVDKYDPINSPILSGFASLKDQVSRYNMSEFNSPSVYNGIFISEGLHTLAIREIQLLYDGFLDPKTIETLKEMKEPTDYISLYYRVAELLRDDRTPKETDPKYMRLRGYERVGGFIYKTFFDAARVQRGAPNPANATLSIKTNDVWTKMVGDPTTMLVQTVNPVHSLKEQEAVSLTGEGGRSAQSLVSRTRVFHKDDVGIFSESVPDSGKVGIRSFLTADAAVKNTLGMMGEYDESSGAVGAFSTSSNLLPASNHDDTKRANLASIQQSAVIPAAGYRMMPYLTGYESVMGSRLDDKFVFNAEQDGEIVKITKDFISVKYKDGAKGGSRLGIWHGEVAGKKIAHSYMTDLPEGKKFKAGEVLAWNTQYFERDFFSKTNVQMKTSAMMTIALLESNDVLEDGCAVDATAAKLMSTVRTKSRAIPIPITNDIFNMVKVGQEVSFDDILLTMVNSDAGSTVTESELKALSRLSNSSPKAKMSGKVTNMTLLYNGELDDMSDSVKALCVAEDKRRAALTNATGKREAKTARVTQPVFFGGEEVIEDHIVIQFFIDDVADLGIGDKISVCNQLKSIVGRNMVGVNRTLDGRDINLIFGWRSINDRIVFSPLKMGAVATTSHHVMGLMLAAYKK